ncbi:unnamed protein product [Lepeophtheirus salmonis]|uniref:(salmon louse) hypothetical protein n=1 Tax=Lepeophtheirus salmonis TaxID=72036 RepID=A0A7R8D5C7_LEPSM|nr:unnamed protein product [Lepeophtheirus salmonis]CAF3034900.1 unnamed protein product [Lepeophtheirus salmonis]
MRMIFPGVFLLMCYGGCYFRSTNGLPVDPTTPCNCNQTTLSNNASKMPRNVKLVDAVVTKILKVVQTKPRQRTEMVDSIVTEVIKVVRTLPTTHKPMTEMIEKVVTEIIKVPKRVTTNKPYLTSMVNSIITMIVTVPMRVTTTKAPQTIMVRRAVVQYITVPMIVTTHPPRLTSLIPMVITDTIMVPIFVTTRTPPLTALVQRMITEFVIVAVTQTKAPSRQTIVKQKMITKIIKVVETLKTSHGRTSKNIQIKNKGGMQRNTTTSNKPKFLFDKKEAARRRVEDERKQEQQIPLYISNSELKKRIFGMAKNKSPVNVMIQTDSDTSNETLSYNSHRRAKRSEEHDKNESLAKKRNVFIVPISRGIVKSNVMHSNARAFQKPPNVSSVLLKYTGLNGNMSCFDYDLKSNSSKQGDHIIMPLASCTSMSNTTLYSMSIMERKMDEVD